jgi:hypothetical protein
MVFRWHLCCQAQRMSNCAIRRNPCPRPDKDYIPHVQHREWNDLRLVSGYAFGCCREQRSERIVGIAILTRL